MRRQAGGQSKMRDFLHIYHQHEENVNSKFCLTAEICGSKHLNVNLAVWNLLCNQLMAQWISKEYISLLIKNLSKN